MLQRVFELDHPGWMSVDGKDKCDLLAMLVLTFSQSRMFRARMRIGHSYAMHWWQNRRAKPRPRLDGAMLGGDSAVLLSWERGQPLILNEPAELTEYSVFTHPFVFTSHSSGFRCNLTALRASASHFVVGRGVLQLGDGCSCVQIDYSINITTSSRMKGNIT